MMEIIFQNKRQVDIADLLWEAQDDQAVKKILKHYGKEAEVVHNMMVSHYLDSVTDTDLANEIIRNFK